MARLRPRISLLTAFLLTTIVCMAMVVAIQWRELKHLRPEVVRLREVTGTLIVRDPNRIHAVESRTADDLRWEWHVWIPENEQVRVKFFWGKVPRTGYPAQYAQAALNPGEQSIKLAVEPDRIAGLSAAILRTSSGAKVETGIPANARWFDLSHTRSVEDGVGGRTMSEETTEKTFLIKRKRVAQTQIEREVRDTDLAIPGFVIWLERH